MADAGVPDAPPADPTRHFAVWPKRLPRTMATPDTTLWANLDISLRRYPDRIAFVYFDRHAIGNVTAEQHSG